MIQERVACISSSSTGNAAGAFPAFPCGRRHSVASSVMTSGTRRPTGIPWNLDTGRLLVHFTAPNVTYCQERGNDDDSRKNTTSTPLDQQLRDDIAREKARVQAELDRLDHQHSCLSCLVTGVGTCVGLAGYFGYLGMEEMHAQQPVMTTTQARQRMAFFGIMSVGWMGLGAYRLYLG